MAQLLVRIIQSLSVPILLLYYGFALTDAVESLRSPELDLARRDDSTDAGDQVNTLATPRPQEPTTNTETFGVSTITCPSSNASFIFPHVDSTTYTIDVHRSVGATCTPWYEDACQVNIEENFKQTTNGKVVVQCEDQCSEVIALYGPGWRFARPTGRAKVVWTSIAPVNVPLSAYHNHGQTIRSTCANLLVWCPPSEEE